MSKLIITGIENGKISYIEGDEVVTSLEDMQEKVNSLREKISSARAVNSDLINKAYEEAVSRINSDYEESVKKLQEARDNALRGEEISRDSKLESIISLEEIEILEREEAKLSLILGSLKAKEAEKIEEEVENTEEKIYEDDPATGIAEVEAPAEEIVEEVESVVKEIQEDVTPVPVAMPASTTAPEVEKELIQSVAQVSIPKPKRIIF